jgi:hypothetical protein
LTEVSGQLHGLAVSPAGKNRLYSLDKRPETTQSLSGSYGEEKITCLCRESKAGSTVIQPIF